MTLSGQWTGHSDTWPNRKALLDIEVTESKYVAEVTLYSEDPGVPSAWGVFETDNLKDHQVVRVDLFPFFAGAFGLFNRDELSHTHPDIDFPTSAEVELRLCSDNELFAKWHTDVPSAGAATFLRNDPTQVSRISPETHTITWRDFRDLVIEFPHRQKIFRGQAEPWSLQTSFHRTGKKRLGNYVLNTIPIVHREVSSGMDRLFNLASGHEFNAFMNLIQHHGFPTPLLDWSYSPFVAAWFAFTELRESDNPVRVFMFDAAKFNREVSNFQKIWLSPPHISTQDVYSLGNPRGIAQQGVLTLTNLADVELHILNLEQSTGESFLQAFDISRKEREIALRDLQMMGISRASLFPGLDGLCSELRGRFFGPPV